MSKIFTTSPYQFVVGELLDPSAQAMNTEYARDAVLDVAAKRFNHAPLTLQFVESCAVGYTQALSQEQRSFRFFCPNTIELVRAFFSYQGTGAGSGSTVQVNLVDMSTGLAPPGVTNPILTISADATASTQPATFLRPVVFTAGQQYRFELTASGAFAAEKAEVTLHLRSDRYTPAGTDQLQTPALVLLNETNDLSAATFAGTVTPITTAAANNFGTALVPALKPILVSAHNFTNAAGFANLLRFDIPRATNTQRRANLIRVFLAAVMSSPGNAGQTVSLQLQDQAGGVLSTTSVSVAAAAAAQTTATIAVNLATSTAGIKSTTASDYRVVLATNDVISVYKAYAYIWVE